MINGGELNFNTKESISGAVKDIEMEKRKYDACTKIDEVEWPTRRPANVLIEEGIETLGDLTHFSREYFEKRAPNCGPATTEEIEKVLVYAGLWWG